MSVALFRAPTSSGTQRQRSHAAGLVDADGHAGVAAFGQPGEAIVARVDQPGPGGARRSRQQRRQFGADELQQGCTEALKFDGLYQGERPKWNAKRTIKLMKLDCKIFS